jgi:hypothetical protein
MGASSGPDTITDGLVFAYDMGNPDKSWKGAPTTNLITNPLPNGTTTGFAAIGGVGTLTYDTQNQAIKWVRTSYESWGAYHNVNPIFNGTLSTSVQYSISFEWKVENNNFSNNVYTYELVQGNAVSPAGTANLAANSTLQPNGWFLFKYTFTPANAGVGDAYNRIYFPSQSANTSTFYWRKIQFEQRAFATPFVSGTRSNTQALFDLTNRSTITASSLTYSSDNSFSFDGIDDTVTANLTGIPNFSALTVNVWFYSNVNTSTCLINNLPFILHFRGAGFYLRSSDGVNDSGYLAWQTLPSGNVWNMLTATWNGTTMKLYLNGNKQSNELSYSGGTTGLLRANENVTVGGYFNVSQPWTNGKIGQAAIYNRALSENEVSQNFNALRGRYGI